MENITDLSSRFHPDHWADLRKSGLSDETIKMVGVYSVRPADIAKILGWNPRGIDSALAFPYPGTNGFIRLKVFPPNQDENGHTVKYLQPKGTSPHLYILPEVQEVVKNLSQPIAIAEGEKKATALLQADVKAIGVGGIWSWVSGENHEAIPEIDSIAWAERTVQILFDSDIWHRPDLLRPVYALGKELELRGARVEVAMIPQVGSEKCGIDDFLLANGRDGLANLKSIPLTHRAFSQVAKWWKFWKEKKASSVKGGPSSDLKTFIDDIRRRSNRELKGFEKKKKITEIITAHLCRIGKLYFTPERQGYFFDNASGNLYALNHDDFLRFLSDLAGLNPTENEFKYLVEELLTEVNRRGAETTVYQLAHYDKQQHKLFISDFGGGIWILDGTTVTPTANGVDGVLFVTLPLLQPFKYLQQSDRIAGATLSVFLEQMSFDPAALTTEERRYLLFIWILSMFFPELHPTKLIPTFIGPQGSTKTTTARRLGIQITGSRFNVGHLESSERGEQAFIATVCGKPFAAFDNADAPIKWLPDRLATFATGHEFELRELYTTNELAIHKPIAHLVLTSRDPYFRRPDVAERLLITRLSRPNKFIPEFELVGRTLEERDSVWSDLLDRLNQSLVALKSVPEAPPMEFRMADFASFGWRLSYAMGGNEAVNQFCELLAKLEREQANYTTEEDPVAACLGFWLADDSNVGREIDTGTLSSELEKVAKHEGLALPKTSAALGKRLHLARRALEIALTVKIGVIPTKHTSRWIFTKPEPKHEKSFVQTPPPAPPARQSNGEPGGEEAQEGQFEETF